MAGTFTKLWYHLVFSTNNRANLITAELQPRLHEYLGGIVRSAGGTALEIGGVPDHVHLLVRWRADEAVSDLLRRVKRNSSAWIHETIPGQQAFRWQEGYGAFSVSHSNVERVQRYIAGQTEQHRAQSFQDEFLEFLRRHEIEYDERYVWE